MGLNDDGTEAVFVNWAYTDPDKNLQVSDAVDSFVFDGGQTVSAATDTVVPVGSAVNMTQSIGRPPTPCE